MSAKLKRIAKYLNAMFPPAILVPAGIIRFFALYFGFQALHQAETLVGRPATINAAFTTILGGLLLRVYDELKDAEGDIRLGKAGDPRYKDRPIVTGEVLLEDIHTLKNGLIFVLFAANLVLPPIAIGGFLLMFGLFWLSSRWFFWPKISESLFLALITHNPLALFSTFYIFCVYASYFDVTGLSSGDMMMMIGMWLPIGAWEISRKQRIPEDETDYETYTKIWGWKTASLVPAIIVLVSTALMIEVSNMMELSWIYPVFLVVVSLIPIGACLAFRLAPSTKTSKLQPFVEVYVVCVDLGLFIALLASRSATWIS